MPRPSDAPIVHATGVLPDRVLIVGSGPAVGYGAVLHELTISGEIARQVSDLTGRGIDIDIVADPRLTIAAAQEALRTKNIARYDAVVLVLGSLELITVSPVRRWRRDLTRLLDWVESERLARLPVVVVGAPPFESMVRLPFIGVFVRHRAALDRASRSVVDGREQVTFVPLRPDNVEQLNAIGRDITAQWAARIAPSVAGVLSGGAPSRRETVNEKARVAAVHKLSVPSKDMSHSIQSIVEMALYTLGAAGASFSLIDTDLQRVQVGAGILENSLDVPRASSLCATTIEQSRLHVVADMTKDEQYRERPYVTGPPGVRFYAGYPVESHDGQRIGSLCIIDTVARTLGNAEAALLRDLALRIQEVYWERSE